MGSKPGILLLQPPQLCHPSRALCHVGKLLGKVGFLWKEQRPGRAQLSEAGL